MSRHRSQHLGFTVWIEARPRVTAAEQNAFMRRLQDYAEAHDLQLGGGPLAALVFADDRSLTATDQVDLLDWLIDDPLVMAVAVSPLSPRLEQPAGREAGYLSVRATDLTLIGLALLYRNRSLPAELYLQLLGGFVRPVTVH
jgi:uncharacterized protein YggL (DUF469 family)